LPPDGRCRAILFGRADTEAVKWQNKAIELYPHDDKQALDRARQRLQL
jgi:hypothetical protein